MSESRVPHLSGAHGCKEFFFVAVGRRPTSFLVAVMALASFMILSFGQQVWSDSNAVNSVVSKPLAIVTLQHPMQLAVSMVLAGIDGPTSTCIAHAGADCCEAVHFTPDDLKVLASADVIVLGGKPDEEIVRVASPATTFIDATTAIPFMSGPADSVPNPHVWMSPLMFATELDVVAGQLGELAPGQSASFRANAHAAGEKLRQLTDDMRRKFATIPSRRVVAYHDAFEHFAADFGFEIEAVIQDGDNAPPASRLADTIRTMKETKTKVVLVDEGGAGERTAEMVASEAGGVVCRLSTLQDGPVTPDAYIDAMRSNVAHLLASFGVDAATNPAAGK